MEMITAVRLMGVLGSRPDQALTCEEIAIRWKDFGGRDVSFRTIQRYMNQFAMESSDMPPLVQAIVGKPYRYYLKTSQVANWFMTEEAALNMQLTRQLIGQSFGKLEKLNSKLLNDIAENVVNATVETQRIRNRLRIVPDGIGRLPAKIDAPVLRACIDAIGTNKKLRISYTNASGKSADKLINPLGLVAKDGSIYLIGRQGLSDSTRHYALHRISVAEPHHHAAQVDESFDIDNYIHATHQFSHPIDSDEQPVLLKLRVSPAAIHHFRERPLSQGQTISAGATSTGWYLVTATIPITVMLNPFLISMGPWIEVLSPEKVREDLVRWAKQINSMYADG